MDRQTTSQQLSIRQQIVSHPFPVAVGVRIQGLRMNSTKLGNLRTQTFPRVVRLQSHIYYI